MKKNILGSTPILAVLMAVLIIGTPSCKTKKKVAQVSEPVEETEAPMENEVDEPATEETTTETAVVERKPEKILSKEQQLNKYLTAVSSASSIGSANQSIEEALTMFDSGDAPVLIVIYKQGANPDYDEPTTIEKYLHYLKDTKSQPAQVEEVVYTAEGKIKELVLKK